MTLKEYLNQKDPVHMPHVVLEKKEYRVTNTHKTPRGEVQKTVYINSDNPLVSGVEYCLIGSHFYTVDRDGNVKNMSCFRINIA